MIHPLYSRRSFLFSWTLLSVHLAVFCFVFLLLLPLSSPHVVLPSPSIGISYTIVFFIAFSQAIILGTVLHSVAPRSGPFVFAVILPFSLACSTSVCVFSWPWTFASPSAFCHFGCAELDLLARVSSLLVR